MPKDDSLDAKMIARGRQVLETEAGAISALAANLDDSFAASVQVMLAARGRIIVSGMGKSGLIARKIAGTLASTGTPSMFVHPAEASHGDLGMITKEDVVLLLSKSGETPELADLIHYTRARDIALIGVAVEPNSTLIQKSDLAIILPEAPEACPNGLAPTTSTTMTLALGDALAIALMEERSFTPENYRDYHPGGKLGAILSTVVDLMHGQEDLPLVQVDAPMSEALIEISAQGFGVTGVVDAQGFLVGVITDGDLRRNMDSLMTRRAEEVMTRDPVTIGPQALASEALARMNESKNITKLFVLAEGSRTPIGIISIHDCIRAGIG